MYNGLLNDHCEGRRRGRNFVRKPVYLSAALLVAVGVLLAACGTAATPAASSAPPKTVAPPGATATPEPTQPPPEPVTITIWHGWLGEQFVNVEKVFRDYEAAHPNVQIDLVNVPDLGNRLVTAIPEGARVDIIAYGTEWIGRLAEAGLIVPISDYGVTEAFLFDTYLGPTAELMLYKGKAWGLPETVECVTWMYNKALVDEADIPRDTDALLSKAAEWNAANPGKWFFVYPARNDVYFSAAWWHAAGAYFVKEDGSVGLDTPEGLRAAQFLAQLPTIMPQDIDYIKATTLFKEGSAAIIQNGPWFIEELETAGVDYGLALIPDYDATGQRRGPFVSGKALLLTPNSEQPDVAVDVMKYFTSAEAQAFLASANGTIPTNKAAVDTPEVQALPVIAHFARQAALGMPLPTTPYMGALWDPVAKALDALWTGAKTPEQAIKDAQELALQGIAAMK